MKSPAVRVTPVGIVPVTVVALAAFMEGVPTGRHGRLVHTPLEDAPVAVLHARLSFGSPAPHVVLQHTPSTQAPDTHWLAMVQAVPLARPQRFPMQLLPAEHCDVNVQLVGQVAMEPSQR